MATKKLDMFDGQSDVTEFVDRVELYGLMKGRTAWPKNYADRHLMYFSVCQRTTKRISTHLKRSYTKGTKGSRRSSL